MPEVVPRMLVLPVEHRAGAGAGAGTSSRRGRREPGRSSRRVRPPSARPDLGSVRASLGQPVASRRQRGAGIPGSTFKFFADEVDFYLDTFRLVARGNVVFSDAEGRIAADEVDFTRAEGTGTFKNASGSMTLGSGISLADFAGQDPDVYFRGEIIEKLGPRRYKITRGAFTTCVQPTPRWEATSKTVNINLDDYAFARNMVLKVKGVPVFYLPAIYYPIQDDNRATGFLLPSYGTSTLRGQAITNGFFWAINRSQDATLIHDWYTQVGPGRRRRVSLRRQRSVAGQRPALWVLAEGNHVHRGRRHEHPAGEQQLPGHRDGQPVDRHPPSRPRLRGLFLRHRHAAALQPEHLPGHAEPPDHRGQPQRHVRRHLDERPLPAQRVPAGHRVVQRVRQHAANLGRRGPADALRHAASTPRWTPSSRASPTSSSTTAW